MRVRTGSGRDAPSGAVAGRARKVFRMRFAREQRCFSGFVCLLPAILVLALVMTPLGARSASVELQEEFSVSRPFGGLVRRDMAGRALRIAAESEGMDRAVRQLAREKRLAFGSSLPPSSPEGEPAYMAASFPLEGVARMLFRTRILSTVLEGFPPSVKLTANAVLDSPANAGQALRQALARRELLELHARILQERRALLGSYDALAVRLLTVNPASDGGMAEAHALQRICHKMDAVEIVIRLLPRFSGQWKEPQAVLLELEKAERLYPESPLILTALAEVLLQLDRPLPALEKAAEAVRLAPEYARAHDVRGIVLLRQRLPSLAAESFSQAVTLSPASSEYLAHRASAYLMSGESKKMCADFVKACGLGDCEGLQWARNAGKCGGK